ncbi:MAG: cobalt ECF transporter T component CbiQ [Nitrospiraceae bacterium]|nr:MAG: cobalt ECF transporter T component CbiQ [Nitrospiraceae bacterium]
MEILSEHFKSEHFLSKVDARVKLIVTLALLAMVLSYKGTMFPLLIAAVSIMLCMKMQIPVKVLAFRLAQPLFLALVILLLKIFFSGKDAMFVFSLPTSHFPLLTLTGYRDGLMEGLLISARILGGVSLLAAVGFATPFIEFMGALSWLSVPKPFIEIMMFAYRYLFVFLEDATTIYSAQKNRLGYTGIKKGLNSFGVLTGSLVLRGLEQSQKTADAMEQRGYTGDMPLLKGKPLSTLELAGALLIVIFGGAAWMI